MQVMLLTGLASALGLNLITIVLGLNYITSVVVVMLGVSLLFLYHGYKKLSKRDYVTLFVFILSSNIVTTVIEKLMLVYDVWGFSNAKFGLVGVNFLSCPIEEFVYWWLAPVVVSVTYIVVVRNQDTKAGFALPSWLDVSAFALTAKVVSEAIEVDSDKTTKVYLESNDVKPEKSVYKRGSKYPVWAMVVVFVLICLGIGYAFFRGSWKAVVISTLVFLLVAYPNELYSLHSGFWVYNNNKMLGTWFLGVPLEEWFMYLASPMSGAMLYSVTHRLLHRETI